METPEGSYASYTRIAKRSCLPLDGAVDTCSGDTIQLPVSYGAR